MASIKIKKRLLDDIEDYCKFNSITDVEKEINDLLQKGFNIVRFGDTPFTVYKTEEVKEETKKTSRKTAVKQEVKGESIVKEISEKKKEEISDAIDTPKKRKVRITKKQ